MKAVHDQVYGEIEPLQYRDGCIREMIVTAENVTEWTLERLELAYKAREEIRRKVHDDSVSETEAKGTK